MRLSAGCDEEKSRAKERVFSFLTSAHSWDPKNQRPELWRLYNARVAKGKSIRAFPLSNWAELDIWQYILVENISIVPLYYAARRPVVERDGMLIMVDDDRLPMNPGEVPQEKVVRFRTLGCYPLTAAIESEATTLPEDDIARDRVGNADCALFGALRPTDRSRRGRINGEEEARGVFLMEELDTVVADAPEAFNEFISAQETKGLLRFLTCGSVDDGKSTLIGRLLYDSKLLLEDQLASLRSDSVKHGTVGDDMDFALLVDGLEAECEQGITIDVAYRFFATDACKFIVADTPGHEQYTPNMATGASTADLAVLLVDARNGIQPQTRWHAFIASLLGIRHVVLAVNKIDLVDFSKERFDEIRTEFDGFAASFDFDSLVAIPMSARYGDNVSSRSARMPWYSGPTLIEYLETVEVTDDLDMRPFRMPVQWVNRPNLDFRGYSGTIASGVVWPGDEVVVAESGKTSKIARIVTMDGDLESGHAGESVTLTLADEVGISRGDLLASAASRPEVSDQFAAHIIWMTDKPLYPGRSYLLKSGARARSRRANSSTASTSIPSSIWLPRSSTSTRSPSAICRCPRRSPSIPTNRTAIPVPSS